MHTHTRATRRYLGITESDSGAAVVPSSAYERGLHGNLAPLDQRSVGRLPMELAGRGVLHVGGYLLPDEMACSPLGTHREIGGTTGMCSIRAKGNCLDCRLPQRWSILRSCAPAVAEGKARPGFDACREEATTTDVLP